MYIGETLVTETYNSTKSDTVVYTPWFGRQGNAATFSVEVVQMSSDAELKVEFFMKNPEDADPGTAVTVNGSTALVITMTSGTTSPATGRGKDLLEWVRCKITLKDTQTGTSTRTAFAVFRLLNPAWETN